MHNADVDAMAVVLVGAADPEIVALEAQIRAAQLGADVSTLDQLIAEDLLFTGPDGQLGTKAQDLAAHGSGAVRFRAHEPEELRIRRVGANVAVSALRARLAVEVAGALVRGTYRCNRPRVDVRHRGAATAKGATATRASGRARAAAPGAWSVGT